MIIRENSILLDIVGSGTTSLPRLVVNESECQQGSILSSFILS
jgi:hypothetical protein